MGRQTCGADELPCIRNLGVQCSRGDKDHGQRSQKAHRYLYQWNNLALLQLAAQGCDPAADRVHQALPGPGVRTLLRAAYLMKRLGLILMACSVVLSGCKSAPKE